ncbi:MAG: hypothetical protein ACK452_07045, partial [Bacteroidota bacterium]
MNQKKSIYLLFIFLIGFYISQSQNNSSNRKTITAQFLYPEIEFSDVAFMTNVLKVKNNNGKNYTFTVSLNIPSGWRSLLDENKEYTLKPNDSVFVPVRVLTTNKKAKGGTKYSIAAYINTNEGKQMAYSRFIAGRPKITNWQMHILPRPKIYFLNGENSSTFQVNLMNEGDEDQEVILSMQKQSNEIMVSDSSGKFLKKNYVELKLPPFSDTTINYNVKVSDKIRNLKRIDTWNYNPSAKARERRYGIFMKASEVRMDPNGMGQKSSKVDFIRLANTIDFVKLSNTTAVGNGSNTIPLTAYLFANNVLGQQPVMNLILQGNSQVGNNAILNYQLQTGFLFYKYTNQYLTNRLNGNITLTLKRWFVGFNAGGGAGNGNLSQKTFFAGYQLNSRHSIGAMIGRERFFGQSNVNFFGLNYGGTFGIFRFNLTSGFNQNPTGKIGYNFVSNLSFNLPKNLSFAFFGSYQLNHFSPTQSFRFQNYGFNFTRSGKRYNISTAFNYLSTSIINNNLTTLAFTNYSLFVNNAYVLKRGQSLQLNSFYSIQSNSNSPLPTPGALNLNFNNTLAFASKPKVLPVQTTPALYLNYSRFFLDTLLSGGLLLNFSGTKLETGMFAGGNLRMGYNKLLNRPDLGSIFNMQSNVFFRYKVWNALALYNYGPIGNVEISNFLKSPGSGYPQTIRLSVGHQFQFRNLHFVLENNPTYVYQNTLNRHSFSIFSQLFYFTDNNLRVSLNAAFNVTSGYSFLYDFSSANSQIIPTESNNKRITDKSFLLGFTLKKDFAIPIPKRFRKKKFCDANFVVFLDVNGNSKMDDGEVPIENVVLRMNDFEVITDDKGKAGFINMSFAKYHVQVIPLIDMGSWFPNVGDSVDVCGPEIMPIPFSKGTQVYGNVELDH